MYSPDIDHDIPFADYPPSFKDVQERVEAAINALAVLDVPVEVMDGDADIARQLFRAESPPTDAQLAAPATVVHLHALLTAYDHEVVRSATQLRNYITNKLLEETASPTASVRIKALELLGKISDVGLFTEKTEVTLRHRPTEELEQMLREKLEKVITGSAETVPPPRAMNRPVDLDFSDLKPKNAASTGY